MELEDEVKVEVGDEVGSNYKQEGQYAVTGKGSGKGRGRFYDSPGGA